MSDTNLRRQVERWIADVCQHRRWTVTQWAQMAGVPPRTVHRFRSGHHKTISRDNMAKLYEAYTRQV